MTRVRTMLRSPALHLVLLTLAIHVTVLLGDSTLYNGIRVRAAIDEHDFARLLEHYTQTGRPWAAYLHYAMSALPGHVHVAKVVSLAFLIGAVLAVYGLARRSRALGDRGAFFVALITAAYPAYSMWHEIIMLPYAMCYGAFFVGAWLYVRGGDEATMAGRARYRVPGLALAAVAFLIPSFLPLAYGGLAVLAVAEGAFAAPRLRSMIGFVRRHLVAIGLPVVFFLAHRALVAPPSGRYAEYNDIRVTPMGIAWGLVSALKRCVGEQLVDIARTPLVWPMLAAALAPLAIGVAIWAARASRPAPDAPPVMRDRRALIVILLLAAFLFLVGEFPYAAVGKNPELNSYVSRHALLLSLPIAIGLVALARLLLTNERLFTVALAVVVAACTLVQLRNGVLWQNRYIKYRAIVAQLAAEPEPRGAIVVLRDEVPFGRRLGYHWEEINWILKEAYGGERHFGFDEGQATPAQIDDFLAEGDRAIYMMRDARFDGSLTVLDVVPEHHPSDLEIYVTYLTSSGAARDAWLRGLVDVRREDQQVTWQVRTP